jgi:hypothetical protein
LFSETLLRLLFEILIGKQFTFTELIPESNRESPEALAAFAGLG